MEKLIKRSTYSRGFDKERNLKKIVSIVLYVVGVKAFVFSRDLVFILNRSNVLGNVWAFVDEKIQLFETAGYKI